MRVSKAVLPMMVARRVAPIIAHKVERDVSVVADALFPNDHFHMGNFTVEQRLKARDTVLQSVERAKQNNH